MLTSKKIEIYKILNSNFVTPISGDPTKTVSYIDNDFVFIFDNQVWVRNRNSGVDDDYSLAIYPPEFVRFNKSLFDKLM